jgi:hypothetical protein
LPEPLPEDVDSSLGVVCTVLVLSLGLSTLSVPCPPVSA